MMEVVRLLSNPWLGKGDSELVQRMGWKLLPYLVITSPQLDFARRIVQCPFLTKHPLTLNWARGNAHFRWLFHNKSPFVCVYTQTDNVVCAHTELDAVMKRSSEPNFIGLANECLVSTLTKNLANMEHFSKRDTVSSNTCCV